MGFGAFLLFTIFGTLTSWLSWLIVLFNVDPKTAGFLGFFLFYLSLFFALSGTFFLLGNFFRQHIVRKHLPVERVSISLRQGILLSALLISWGLLQAGGKGSLLNTLLLIVAVTLLEFFFVSQHKTPTSL